MRGVEERQKTKWIANKNGTDRRGRQMAVSGKWHETGAINCRTVDWQSPPLAGLTYAAESYSPTGDLSISLLGLAAASGYWKKPYHRLRRHQEYGRRSEWIADCTYTHSHRQRRPFHWALIVETTHVTCGMMPLASITLNACCSTEQIDQLYALSAVEEDTDSNRPVELYKMMYPSTSRFVSKVGLPPPIIWILKQPRSPIRFPIEVMSIFSIWHSLFLVYREQNVLWATIGNEPWNMTEAQQWPRLTMIINE